jgi:hypothetical protein
VNGHREVVTDFLFDMNHAIFKNFKFYIQVILGRTPLWIAQKIQPAEKILSRILIIEKAKVMPER